MMAFVIITLQLLVLIWYEVWRLRYEICLTFFYKIQTLRDQIYSITERIHPLAARHFAPPGCVFRHKGYICDHFGIVFRKKIDQFRTAIVKLRTNIWEENVGQGPHGIPYQIKTGFTKSLDPSFADQATPMVALGRQFPQACACISRCSAQSP